MSAEPVRFDALLDQAGREPLPPIDVADRVLKSIESLQPVSVAESPAWWAAALSAATALAVLWLASSQGVLFEDPFANWLRCLVVVMR